MESCGRASVDLSTLRGARPGVGGRGGQGIPDEQAVLVAPKPDSDAYGRSSLRVSLKIEQFRYRHLPWLVALRA